MAPFKKKLIFWLKTAITKSNSRGGNVNGGSKTEKSLENYHFFGASHNRKHPTHQPFPNSLPLSTPFSLILLFICSIIKKQKVLFFLLKYHLGGNYEVTAALTDCRSIR